MYDFLTLSILAGILAVLACAMAFSCSKRYEIAIFLITLSPLNSAILLPDTQASGSEQEAGIGGYIRICLVLIIGAVGLFNIYVNCRTNCNNKVRSMAQSNGHSYALISAARNEKDYIERTLNSVVSQRLLPKKWVIVSDGSTDRTDEIISKYVKKYDFIQLVRVEDQKLRDFSSKVYAINIGYENLRNCNYNYLGNLDADISFSSRYYENILTEFEEDPRLGIAGGFIYEQINGQFECLTYNSSSSVAGTIQMFRRECYENINGYIPQNTHPDYMQFYDDRPGPETYPASHYRRFLEHVRDVYGDDCWRPLPRECARWFSTTTQHQTMG
jgi:hypothetical protein